MKVPSAVSPIPHDLECALAGALAPVDPPPGRADAMWQRISARLAEPAGGSEGLTSIAIDSLVWKRVANGVYVKDLSKTPRQHVFVMKIEAGHACPAHAHEHDEESVLLSGDAWIGDTYFGTVGDYHRAAAGTSHPPIRSPKGCMLYCRVSAG
jgi:anti-sigma factor ChrR (cupin superfamily)